MGAHCSYLLCSRIHEHCIRVHSIGNAAKAKVGRSDGHSTEQFVEVLAPGAHSLCFHAYRHVSRTKYCSWRA